MTETTEPMRCPECGFCYGALKSALSIPGVRVYAERQLASRS